MEDFARRLAALPAAPAVHGRLTLMVARIEPGEHLILERARLTPETGVPGDRWERGASPRLDSQVTAMQSDVARLLAGEQPLSRFGDNLFLELDLSQANLPAGRRLRIGEAILEVTPKPHNGCKKFVERFGEAALRLVSDAELRPRNLRGLHLRVVVAGEVRPGDAVEVLALDPAQDGA
jgi:MOSC domain-containing protein YiiM